MLSIERTVVASALVVITITVIAEVAHWHASWRHLGDGRRRDGQEAVVILGFRNRGSVANYVNRYRIRAGLRSIDSGTKSVLVLSGGAADGLTAEAEVLREYACQAHGYQGAVLMDRTSTSTRENVENVIPLVEDCSSIKIVSNSLHAARARAYLWSLRPDLARRLVRAREHRFAEMSGLKVLALASEMFHAGRGDRHRFRTAARSIEVSRGSV